MCNYIKSMLILNKCHPAIFLKTAEAQPLASLRFLAQQVFLTCAKQR